MMGQWIHPAYGWGLLALLVPLAIHLWNRRQGRVIQVGSIQLHRPTETARASRLSLHEVALWLLRSALVAAMVALLVDWQYPPQKPNPSGTWQVLDPAAASTLVGTSLDSTTTRWMVPGFPTLQQLPHAPAISGPAWPTLLALSELPEQPDTVQVMTHLTTKRWPQPSPQMPVVVEWLPVPHREAPVELVQAWQTDSSTREWWAETEAYTVRVTEKLGKGDASPAPEWRVYLDALPQDKAPLEAAIRLCAEYVGVPLSWADEPNAANYAFLFGKEKVVSTSATQIHFQSQPASPTWWSPDPQAANRVRWHHLPRAGQVSPGLWRELPQALLTLMVPQPTVALPIPPQHLPVASYTEAAKLPEKSASTLLLLIIIGLLMAERMVATWRKA